MPEPASEKKRGLGHAETPPGLNRSTYPLRGR